MPISVERSLLIIVVCGLVVFTTRAIPFVLFSGKKEIPEIVKYLGKVLPPAVVGMLVIYCLKAVNVVKFPFGLPEFIAVFVVIVLHVWKRNNLLSSQADNIRCRPHRQVPYSARLQSKQKLLRFPNTNCPPY